MNTKSTFLEFQQRFDTEEKCVVFLANEKQAQGYQCRRCSNDTYYKGKTRYWRKCTSCDYDESPTAHTLFHKCKIPLVKAFWMVYWVSSLKKGMSSCEITRQLGVAQKTAWFWKRKIQESMKSTGTHLLDGPVQVDETFVGGPEKGKQGRAHGKKKIIAIAVEIGISRKGNRCLKRAYAGVIENSSSAKLKEFLVKTVSPKAMVMTDGWHAYREATGDRIHLVQKSEGGKNFKLLHFHIMNLKGWIRGIHHHISAKHAQAYFDEAHYRFNRRNSRWDITINTLNRMVKHPWFSYKLATRDVSH